MPDVDVITVEHAGLCDCGTTFSPGETVGYHHGRDALMCESCMSRAYGAEDNAGVVAASFGAMYGAQAVAVMDIAAARHRRPATHDAPPATLRAPEGSTCEANRHRHARVEELSRRGAPLRLIGRMVEPSAQQVARAAKQGAEGEEMVVETLSEVTETGAALTLHDRHVPGRRVNIEHIAVGACGVFVVDAKRYARAPIAVRRAGGPFGRQRADLFVRGRMRNDLVKDVEKQAAVVRELLEGMGLGEIPVTPVLCFVEGSFPAFHSQIPVNRTIVVGRKALRKLVGHAGRLDAQTRERIYVSLAASLPGMA